MDATEMKHTPGPWEYDGENPANQGYDVALPDGGTLATAYYDEDRDEYSARQAEANARLIAAAPDLLAVVERYLAAQDADCWQHTLNPNDSRRRDCFKCQAIAAVAKARRRVGGPLTP